MSVDKKIKTLLLLLSLTVTSAMKADVKPEVLIDSLQMIVGEQTGMHISVAVKPGQKVKFPQFVPQQDSIRYITSGVEVVRQPVVDTVDADNGEIMITQHLVLTAFQDSVYQIPAQTIQVDGKDYKTNPLALKVYTMKVDTTQYNTYFGPKDVQDNPFLWSEWLRVFLFAVLAMMLYVIGWLAYLRLKSDKPISFKVRIIKKVPPHQRALTEIESIKNTASAETEKEYYTRLTDALRKYIEERFGFNAMEMTSSEIIQKLREVGDQEKLNELMSLFETADLVKFAKYSAAVNDHDRNLVSAVEFINTTKQENVPLEERIMPSVTEQERQTMRLRTILKCVMAVLIVMASAAVAYVFWMVWDLR